MTRLFGTHGFRGLVNEEITATVAHDVGHAMAMQIGLEKTVGIGWDTRSSSEMLGLAFSAGLMNGGCNAYLLGLVPSPLLSYAIPKLELDAGAMITASHNPPEFNGIKLWGSDGAAFTTEVEQKVEDHYFTAKKPHIPWHKCGRLAPAEDFRLQYIEGLLNQINEERLLSRQFHVVADCGGGAASMVVPPLLNAVTAQTDLLFCKPDGLFKNRLPEPKKSNLTKLMQHVKDTGADIGMAWDGDADRLVLITETGRYLMGDRVFALAVLYWLRDLKEKPKYVVTQVATSDVILDVAQAVNAEPVFTRVGEPNLVTKMKQVNAVIAGGETGGVIYRGWSWSREGILTALFILDLMASDDQTLEQLDQQFPAYFQVKEGVKCENKLKQPLLVQIINSAPTDAECETLDGVKLRYSDGWLLMRPSGTEPIFRVFAEAKTDRRAKSLVKQGLNLVQDKLKEIRKGGR